MVSETGQSSRLHICGRYLSFNFYNCFEESVER